jgi:translation initiation factor 2 subunit 3
MEKEDISILSKHIIEKQATINIGTIGHVSHGKSTVVKALTGRKTQKFKHEKERNITIKLGYANAKIYECLDCDYYTSTKSSNMGEIQCKKCDKNMILVRHISFVDCPGHDILMATMLSGCSIMDGACLLIAANQTVPQSQTAEHLAAIEVMKLENVIILQNKIDLINQNQAEQQYRDIKRFVAGTIAEKATIIPIAAQTELNIQLVCKHLIKDIPIPKRDYESDPIMSIIRSFDINKPGELIKDLKGGVIGGSLLKGILKIGQDIEIRPGIINKLEDGTFECKPLFSKIISLCTEENDLEFAVPGGLIGIGTEMDPVLTRADRRVGQILGLVGKLPDIYYELEINFYIFKILLGGKSEENIIKNLEENEIIMINIGSNSIGAKIIAIKKDLAKIELLSPICTFIGEKIAISRRINKYWRLIGFGTTKKGSKALKI